jgi:hypothetical protein
MIAMVELIDQKNPAPQAVILTSPVLVDIHENVSIYLYYW